MRTAASVQDLFLAMIHKYEQGPHGGFASTVYKDEGVPCIGYGHDIHDPNDPLMTATLDQSGADQLAMQDGEIAAQQLDGSLGAGLVATLTDQQFVALLDFVFNLGIGQFNGSTLKNDIISCHMDLAADQFPRWCHAGGVMLPGLLARRNEEKALWTGAQTSVM
jgi:lysozyme